MFIIDWILNIGVSKQRLIDGIEAMDADRDGYVTIREIIAVIKRVTD
jgi:Ca2+-binding EF-hand superfamily protein